MSKHNHDLREVDEKLNVMPFAMLWDHYSINLEPDGRIVSIIFEDSEGVRVSIPLCRKDIKMLRKHLKKLEQVLL